MRLETARLVIRSFEAHDADPWIALVNDSEVGRFTPPSPPATLETFHGALARRQTMERERGYAMWAVDLKGTDSFIGQCGLYPAEGKGPEVEPRLSLCASDLGATATLRKPLLPYSHTLLAALGWTRSSRW